ncbi:MAG: response regulator [Gammaproteobacteria bacterium]|nr:response regulator [Gammaproteobacteria bacterium]
MANILTADDSASMREMVLSALTSAGHEVSQAVDGEDALETAKKGKYNLVLTDLNMPKMDGITLIKRLRQLPEYKFVPILMLTTESDHEKKMAGKEAGATGWIVKPFDPEKLIAVINKVVS